MKKNIQKFTAIMLTMLLLLSTLSLNGLIQVEAATTDGGKVSNTINWNYNDGTLTISGSGKMPNYKTVNYYYEGIVSDAPWGDYLSSITSVSISGAITNIGDCAFSDCPLLATISMPSTIKVIGSNSFARCSKLEKVVFPNSLTEIGQSAFIGCSRIEEISIPDTVTSIKGGAFQACSNLKTVKLSSSLTSISSSLFQQCSRLNGVTIPSSVTEIGSTAFYNCSALTEMIIPQSVTRLYDEAFSNCSSITEMNIPESVTHLHSRAFQNCTSLKKITINNKSTSFFHDVFKNCNKVTVYGYTDSTTEKYCEENGYAFSALDADSSELDIKTFEIDKKSGQKIGTKITLSAKATGGSSPYKYLFYYKDADGNEKSISSYSNSNNTEFTLTTVGTFSFGVRVKDNTDKTIEKQLNNFQVFGFTGFAGGDGSKNNPYLITDVPMFLEINKNINSSYKLANNIDLSSFERIEEFNGIFDGGGYTIKISLSEKNGIFNNIKENGIVKNIKIKIDKISDFLPANFGSVCLYNHGKILKCFFSGSISSPSNYSFKLNSFGGIAADNYGTIDKCRNSTSLNIDRSVTTSGFRIGGICGNNYSNGKIENCLVDGYQRVLLRPIAPYGPYFTRSFFGGISGYSTGEPYSSINNCAINNNLFFGNLSDGDYAYNFSYGLISGDEYNTYDNGLCLAKTLDGFKGCIANKDYKLDIDYQYYGTGGGRNHYTESYRYSDMKNLAAKTSNEIVEWWNKILKEDEDQPDPSTFEFSLSGKNYFVLNKDGNLNVSYQSAVDGQVLSELKNIKWTNSNPDIATVSGLDTGVADTGNNKVSVMATVKALNVGTTTIEGTSPDGRKASFTINVEPEIISGGSYQISRESEVTLCKIQLNSPNFEYLNDFASKITIKSNNNGIFSVKDKTTKISDDYMSATIIYKLLPEEKGSVIFSISSQLGQEVKTTVDSVSKTFICEQDGNSFTHSKGVTSDGVQLPDNGIYGFYNINNHEINSSELRAKILSAASSESEMSELLEAMESEWHGSCYGLATVIGLTFTGKITLDDISEERAKNFHSLTRPCENRKLLDAIEYYHLSQQTKNFGSKSGKCVSTYFDSFKGIFNKYNLSNVKSNDDFFRSLIQAVKDEYMVILGYSEKDGGGHAVLTCGLEEKNNEYIIKIYDENDRVAFDKLIIRDSNGKLTATYECSQDENEDLMGELVEMDYTPLSALKDINPYSSKKSVATVGAKQSMIVTVPINQEFRLKNENGKELIFDGKNFSGNIEIFGVYNIHDTNNDKIKIEISKSFNLEFVPFSNDAEIIVSDDNNYYSLSASKIDRANFNLGNGINVKGSNFSFKTGINHYNSAGKIEVVSISGNANGNTTVLSDDNDEIVINSEQIIDDLSVDLISEDDYQNIAKNERTIEYTVSNNSLVGDVNLDGQVSIIDATTVQQYLAKFLDLSDIQKKVADTDGDGTITITDATVIQQYLAEYIDHFNQPSAIKLNTNAVTLNVSDTHSLLATISPSDVTNKSVTWTSSDNDIATISNGTVTAKSPGTAKITAKTYNGKTAKCTVTVKQIEPSSVSLNKNTLSLNEGDSYQLTATVSPSNATNKTITWVTNNPAIATVNSNGKVKGNASGSATITATTSNGKKASCTITVISTSPTSIAPDHWSYYLTVGETTQILPIIKPDNAKTTVSWNSSDNSIATVNSSGTVTAVSEGTATITLTTDNGLSERCGVIVKKISIGSFYNYIDHDLTVLSKMYKQPQGLIVGQDDSVFIYNYKDRDTKVSDPSKFSEFSKSLKIMENTYIVRVNQNDYLGFYRTMFENRSLDAKVYNSVVQHQVDAFYDACEASYYYTYFSTGDIEFSDFESRYKQCVENQRNHQKSAIIGIVDELYNSTLDINDKEIYHNGDNSVYQGLKSKIENAKTKSDVEALVQYFEKNFSK